MLSKANNYWSCEQREKKNKILRVYKQVLKLSGLSEFTLSRLEILAKSVYNWFAVLGCGGGGVLVSKRGVCHTKPGVGGCAKK